jgi:splicing factor 3A subunit 3
LEEADEAPPPPAEINTGEEEEEDDDGKIYNPLKLPLGWDGKPIPFWLYKLHGRCSFHNNVFVHKKS